MVATLFGWSFVIIGAKQQHNEKKI